MIFDRADVMSALQEQDKNESCQGDPIPAKHVKGVRLHISQEPSHDDKRNNRGNDGPE